MSVMVTNLDDSPTDDGGFNQYGSGNMSIELFADALFVWIIVQKIRPVTVAEASMVFNMPPDLIRKAIDHRMDLTEGDHQRINIERGA